jgi:hypothetical protein
MDSNYWEGTPYAKEIAILEKWNDRVGFPLTWKQATVCEHFEILSQSGKDIAGTTEAGKSPVNGLTSLVDLMDLFQAKEAQKSELAQRKERSANWEEGIKLYLKELEEYIQTPDEFEPRFQEWKQGRFGLEHSERVYRPGVQLIAYQDMLLGNIKKPLFQYAEHLSPAEFLDPLPVPIRESVLKDIAKGAALAYIIPRLKVESKGETYQEPKSDRVKLRWTGQKNQLYGVIQQLKENELISNTYNQIADFLKENVIPFHSASKENIEKELKKDFNKPENLAKGKRIKLDLDQED